MPERLHRLIAAAVVHHRHRKLRRQGRENVRQKMGGGHQINVFRSLGNELLHGPAEGGRRHLPAKAPGADLLILAVQASQGTAGKENGPAAARPCQGRLLPLMAHHFGHLQPSRHPANAQLSRRPVYSTGPGAQRTGCIVHRIPHPFLRYFPPTAIILLHVYYTGLVLKGQVFSSQSPRQHKRCVSKSRPKMLPFAYVRLAPCHAGSFLLY